MKSPLSFSHGGGWGQRAGVSRLVTGLKIPALGKLFMEGYLIFIFLLFLKWVINLPHKRCVVCILCSAVSRISKSIFVVSLVARRLDRYVRKYFFWTFIQQCLDFAYLLGIFFSFLLGGVS